MEKRKMIFLFLLSFVIYSNTFFNSFMWDDYALLNDKNLTPQTFSQFFSKSFWQNIPQEERGRFRPLRTFLLVLDREIYGDKPSGFHITNALLNSINSMLVYRLGLTLFNPETAFACALIFTVHPVHVESVAWVKNRSDLLCGIFYFICLIFFIKFLNTGRFLFAFMSFFSMFFSILAKESGITIPLIMFILSFLLYKNPQRKKGFYLSLFAFSVLCLWFFLKEFWWRKEIFAPLNLIMDANIQGKIVFYTLDKYLSLLFMPFNLSAEHKFILDRGFSQFWGLGLVFFMLLGIYFIFKKDRKSLLGYLWVIISLLPVINIVFLEGRPIAEQRLYLPSAGFAFMIGNIVCRNYTFFQRTADKSVKIVFYAVLLILGGQTFVRNFVWKNDLAFWSDVVKKNPTHYRANFHLAAVYQKKKDYIHAVKYYEIASQDSDRPEAFYGLGFCYDQIGEYDKSIENYDKVLKLLQIYPENEGKEFLPDVYNNAGIVYEKKGNVKKAEELYLAALKIKPDYVPAKKNLDRLKEKSRK